MGGGGGVNVRAAASASARSDHNGIPLDKEKKSERCVIWGCAGGGDWVVPAVVVG